MGSVIDQTSLETFSLPVNEPFILGRGSCGIKHKMVSRKQVQLILLEDGRCFARRLSQNPAFLDGKLLPMHKEIEAMHNSVIHLLPNSLPMQIQLSRQVSPSHRIIITERVTETCENEESATTDDEGLGTDDTEEHEDNSLSAESSLLGDESWDEK